MTKFEDFVGLGSGLLGFLSLFISLYQVFHMEKPGAIRITRAAGISAVLLLLVAWFAPRAPTSVTPTRAVSYIFNNSVNALTNLLVGNSSARPYIPLIPPSPPPCPASDALLIGAPSLLSEALSSLPGATISLEYDNLSLLRQSPNFDAISREYGAEFQGIKSLLSQLGMDERSVQELVSGHDASTSYGILRGMFNVAAAMERSPRVGVRSSLIGSEPVFCAGEGPCLLFLSNSVAAFGNENYLNWFLNSRYSLSAPLLGTPIERLLAKADYTAPVIGVSPGSELSRWMGNSVAQRVSSQIPGYSQLTSQITLFQYNTRFDKEAHINLYFDCPSTATAHTLSFSLKSLNALSISWEWLTGKTSALPVTNVNTSAEGTLAHLVFDAPIY